MQMSCCIKEFLPCANPGAQPYRSVSNESQSEYKGPTTKSSNAAKAESYKQGGTAASTMSGRFLRMLPAWATLALAVSCFAQAPAAQSSVGPITEALRNRDFQSALSLCQSALASHPSDYRIWTLRGMALAATGKLPLASKSYQQALRFAPDFLPAIEGVAQSEFQLGREDARPYLLRVLTLRPDDPVSHAYLGVLDSRKRDCTNAVSHFEHAESVIHNEPGILSRFGYCLAILGRDGEAAPVFAQVVALDPDRPEARYNLALAHLNEHHPDEALAALQPLLQRKPVQPDILVLAADAYEAKDDTAHAVELLRQALLANPNDLDTYMRFATLSYDHASPQVGVDILNVGLKQLPKEPKLYLVRGILLTQLGEFSQASEDFATAGRFDPKLTFLGVAEGLVESQQHDSAKAIASFRAAAKAHPDEAYAQYLLAEALSEKGSGPGTPEYAEEVAAAKRAVQLDPHLVAARDLLGSIYFESGRTNDAIQQSRSALAIDPNDQQAIYHLIVALRKTDQKAQVPMLLKRLLQLRANNGSNAAKKKRFLLNDNVRAMQPEAR